VKFDVHVLFLQTRQLEGSDYRVVGTFMNIDPIEAIISVTCLEGKS